MFSPEKNLVIPSDFGFPFKPYDIQQNLMESMFSVIENKQIGIFESPTGTGKSLTLTCSALKWLEQHNELIKIELIDTIQKRNAEIKELENDSNKTYDWIESQFKGIEKKNELTNLKRIHDLIEDYEKTMQELKRKKVREKLLKKVAPNAVNKSEDLLFEKSGESEEDLFLDDLDGEQPIDEFKEEEKEQYKHTKIFFCSRTHSQLSQVVREIKRTKYGEHVRCITLASRQNLCIHPEVKKLPMSLLNERCLDMQKAKSKVTSVDNDGQPKKRSKLKCSQTKCPYKTQNAITDLRDNSLVDILDIEDLVKAGKTLNSCPYYSGKEASKDAQIIMMPYQMLLHRKTRLQAGIELKNNVVIIDEAHNLFDTISSIYSAEVSLSQLQLALSQMLAYKLKYSSRFLTKNLLKINQLIFVTKRLIKLIKNNIINSNSDNNSSIMMKTHELMSEGEFFNINLYHILEFCEQTRFAQKVQGFSQKAISQPVPNENIEPKTSGTSEILKRIEENNRRGRNKKETTVVEAPMPQKEKPKLVPSASAVHPLLGFLESLTECADDGRVLITNSNDGDETKAILKFILLNPEGHFNEIVKDCRSVIVAGGTMQPVTELTDQLFKSCPERIKLHFYDHVVSDEAVLPLAVSSGPTGKRFIFNYTQRNNHDMIKELGMTILNVCSVIPAGVVCFFSSYDYLDAVLSQFTKEEVLAKLEQRKQVFREPRSGSGQKIEKILLEYSKTIKNPDRNGAVLFSVVGGKLSEGLNFADNLGRCVIVVGMPYPNKNSPVLKEKIKYLNITLGNSAGNEYYDNLCMKAVNQCIGRSVRHINDYACVLLIDERYANERVRSKLPIWISRNLRIPQSFGAMQGSIANFFRNKRFAI